MACKFSNLTTVLLEIQDILLRYDIVSLISFSIRINYCSYLSLCDFLYGDASLQVEGANVFCDGLENSIVKTLDLYLEVIDTTQANINRLSQYEITTLDFGINGKLIPLSTCELLGEKLPGSYLISLKLFRVSNEGLLEIVSKLPGSSIDYLEINQIAIPLDIVFMETLCQFISKTHLNRLAIIDCAVSDDNTQILAKYIKD